MQTKAHIRASYKYNKIHYKTLAIRVRPEVLEMVNNYCDKIGMSKASTLTNAVRYLIDNDINLVEWIAQKQTDNNDSDNQSNDN